MSSRLPSTMATLYAWAWMTREKSWLEGLGVADDHRVGQR